MTDKKSGAESIADMFGGLFEDAKKKIKKRKSRMERILSNEPVEDESDNRPQGNDTKKKK